MTPLSRPTHLVGPEVAPHAPEPDEGVERGWCLLGWTEMASNDNRRLSWNFLYEKRRIMAYLSLGRPRMNTESRSFHDTLLHCKRGEYGPLWLFELDPETWAIVWSGSLEDEAICHLILAEDPGWFNRAWSQDGRRPNPTYKTQAAALEEVIRSLRTMKADLRPDDEGERTFAASISRAEQDLHKALTEVRAIEVTARGVSVQKPMPVHQATEPHVEMPEGLIRDGRVEGSLPPIAQTAEVKKPWEELNEKPTSVNFMPDASLHAKMQWVCDNVPKMSRLRLVREAVDMYCDQLIAKRYKG